MSGRAFGRVPEISRAAVPLEEVYRGFQMLCLEEGMVLTHEPGIAVGNKILVHEEDIVITNTGARYLSPRAQPELPEL